MQRYKKIYILIAVLAVVSIATFAVSKYEEHKENIKNSNEIILSVPHDTVTDLSWEYEDNLLSLHKEEKWLYDEDAAFPVDEEKINDMLEQFESFGASFIIEDVEDFAQYGLDNPLCTIKMTADEKAYEINLGNFSEMDSERYASIGDGNVYLVPNDPLDHFDAALSDIIDHDETPSFDEVTKIQFTGKQSYTITFEENSKSTYCDEDIYFTKTNNVQKPLDTTRVENYLDNISSLSLIDYVTYNVTEEELKTYGLASPEFKVAVSYTYKNENEEEINDTFVLSVGRNDNEVKEAEADDDEETNASAYVRIGESKIIYKVSADVYEELIDSSYNSLRHLEVLSASFDDITKIDISLEGKQYSITSEVVEEEKVYYYNGEKISITDLQSGIENLEANSFTDKKQTEKLEVELVVYLENENYPKVQIELYRYDGDECLAVVDGEPISLIDRSDVVDLIESINTIVLG